MIGLIQPMWSRQEINSDSNYVLLTALVRAMRQIRPDYQFVVTFPDSKSGYKYESDGFFSLPNVFRIPYRTSPRKMASVFTYNASFYDQLMRNFAFDFLLVNQVEIAAQLAQSGQATFSAAGRPLTIAAHYYVIHPSLPYLFDGMMDHVAFAQLFGARFTDWNVFNSNHCQSMFEDIARMYLNDSTVTDILSKSSMIPMGTLEDSLRLKVNDNDVPIIIYNHRLQTYKNYKKTFEILNELWNEGVKFKVYVTSSSAENTVKILSYPFVELKLCAKREDYLAVLAQGDLNVTNSQHETFCMSAVESMACGQVLVAPDGITFPQITGSEESGYPYLFKTDTEQLSMLRVLLQNNHWGKTERQKWGQILSRFVRSNFSRLTWADNYATLIEDKLSDEKYIPGTKDDVLEDMKMRLEMNDGCEIKEFWNIVAQRKINGRIPWGSQSLSYTKLGRLVSLLGGSVRIERGKCRVYK